MAGDPQSRRFTGAEPQKGKSSMVAQPATSTALDALARRVNSPRPASIATLRHRHAEACRLSATIRRVLNLLDSNDAGWAAVLALALRAGRVAGTAFDRYDAAWQAHKAAAYEAEELAGALDVDRLAAFEYDGFAAD